MKSLVKWKENKEAIANMLIKEMPEEFVNYYEPFAGGGSIYLNVEAKYYFINDLCSELMEAYRFCHSRLFIEVAEDLNRAWCNMGKKYEEYKDLLIELGVRFYERNIDTAEYHLKNSEILRNIRYKDLFSIRLGNENDFEAEKRFRVGRALLMAQKHKSSISSIPSLIETALKQALYVFVKDSYNNSSRSMCSGKFAMFLFLMDKAAGGQFRIEDNGKLHVSYAGRFYNNHFCGAKNSALQSKAIKSKFARTTFCDSDFELFLNTYRPKKNDFIFLDPPTAFMRENHERLAKYLKHDCTCKWMLIVKDTQSTREIYCTKGRTTLMIEKKGHKSSSLSSHKNNVQLIIKNY